MIARNYLGKWLTVTSSLILSNLLGVGKVALAQVIADETLSTQERTQVLGDRNFQIDGGAIRGSNLFHSFREFSLPTGGEVYFNNARNIENIFSRVTGRSISNIDGVIRANGTANLFLINPNGIIFGANARLNIGGSFLASTADSINFADGVKFSATNPQTEPLLTINVPIGLQFGQNSGSITVQGTGYDLSVQEPIRSPTIRGNAVTGLQVLPGESLVLLGGNVNIQGGTLKAEQGRIELGSVGDGQQVAFSFISQGFALNYQGVKRFGNISLSQQALADASGGGFIQVQGNQISLTDASQILIQNQGEQPRGSINVNAAQSLSMSSTSPDGRLRSGLDAQTVGSGAGADIAISTQQLIVQGGAAVSARSFGSGKAGSVTVDAADSVQILRFSPFDLLRTSSIGTVALSSGDAGDISLSTRQLTVQDGGSVAVSTLGSGDAGELTINALDSVELLGVRDIFQFSSLSAPTLGSGNGGKITINTARLILQNGGTVNSSTVATGNGGSVSINAQESVAIAGTGLNSALPSSVRASAPIPNEQLRQAYQLSPVPSGSSGNVTINTQNLSVTNGGSIEVSNQGLGNAGNLQINAQSIFLDTNGAITSATASGEGGNIQLQVRDLLLMRRTSEITASASGTGNGGNININTPLLVAVPQENSDISANSVNARGGNVNIKTNGIFGFQSTLQNTFLSNISATGGNSTLNGTVQINVENITPNNGLVEFLPLLSDTNTLIANSCIIRNPRQSRFIITGSGGLPTLPDDLANSPFPTYELVPTTRNSQNNTSLQQLEPLSEPDGIYQLSNGEIVLGRSCAKS
ncbi:filamentous hemagglutinin N-terminal domain-containing protein [Nostoc linckia FACHB-104]|nr:filamentous hemagglutinin N-terminal domain-containing protein [Nostoc linckia FACHB-104]